MNISSAEVGDMTNTVTKYSVDTATTDGASDQKETVWVNTKYSQYLGYVKSIPELKSTIFTRARWIIGKGYQADNKTKAIMDKWRGWGKDTANQIIFNMATTSYTGGDFYAEIIRDDAIFTKIFMWTGLIKIGKPINLKPLDPGKMGNVVNKQGMLVGYDQLLTDGTTHRFKPEEIFHLAKDRFADEIHGTSIIPVLEKIILARAEAMADIRTVFHRYVKPLWVWSLDTDDETKVAEFKAKADRTVEESENIYIPKGAAEAERVSVPQYSTLDPLPYIATLTDQFYQATNTPDVVIGSAKQTVEASAKILFLGFEQSVRFDQLHIMENFKSQLGLDIKLEFPTPIEADLIDDEKKDGPNTEATQKNDTTAGSGK